MIAEIISCTIQKFNKCSTQNCMGRPINCPQFRWLSHETDYSVWAFYLYYAFNCDTHCTCTYIFFCRGVGAIIKYSKTSTDKKPILILKLSLTKKTYRLNGSHGPGRHMHLLNGCKIQDLCNYVSSVKSTSTLWLSITIVHSRQQCIQYHAFVPYCNI